MKTGIVIAMEEEFRKVLCDREIHKLSEAPFSVFAVSGAKDAVAVVSGIGKVCAAAATAYLIDNYEVDEIINFGVCGATKSAFIQAKTAIISKVVNKDFDLHLPAIEGGEPATQSIVLNTGKGDAVLYTSDAFTTSSENDGYFDMEGYAVAHVARLYNKKCLLIKSVTDIIDSGIQTEQFICNYDRTCGLLRETLKKYL